MKNLIFLFFALFSLAFLSCKDNPKEPQLETVEVDNTADAVKTYEVAKTEAEFKDSKMEAVFNQYMKVENALVNTDSNQAQIESSKLQELLKELNSGAEAEKAVMAMAGTDDIKIQRENFEQLSTGIEKMLEGSLKSGTLYKQYCPMAFNNKGASWISTNKEILNPYFGDKMLKCGRVDAEIQ